MSSIQRQIASTALITISYAEIIGATHQLSHYTCHLFVGYDRQFRGRLTTTSYLFHDSDRSLSYREVRSGSILNPRNGQPEFDTSLFAPETLAQLGNSPRRSFMAPAL
jgi:hypothetical protein